MWQKLTLPFKSIGRIWVCYKINYPTSIKEPMRNASALTFFINRTLVAVALNRF